MGILSKRRYDPNDSEYEGDGTSWGTHCAQDSRFNLSGSASGVLSSSVAIDQAIRAKQVELKLTDEYVDALTIEMGALKS